MRGEGESEGERERQRERQRGRESFEVGGERERQFSTIKLTVIMLERVLFCRR